MLLLLLLRHQQSHVTKEASRALVQRTTTLRRPNVPVPEYGIDSRWTPTAPKIAMATRPFHCPSRRLRDTNAKVVRRIPRLKNARSFHDDKKGHTAQASFDATSRRWQNEEDLVTTKAKENPQSLSLMDRFRASARERSESVTSEVKESIAQWGSSVANFTKDGAYKLKEKEYDRQWGNAVSNFSKDSVNKVKNTVSEGLLTNKGSVKSLPESVGARIKDASESLTKAVKEGVPENYPESLRKALKDASETATFKYASKDRINNFWERTKLRSADAFVSARRKTASVLSSASATATIALRRTFNRATEATRSRLEAAKDSAVDKMQSSMRAAYDRMRDVTSSSVQAIMQPIWNAWASVVHKWQSVPVWNRFWWWSLAAIGVYGIATTVPKEVIKQTIQQSSSSSSKVKKDDAISG